MVGATHRNPDIVAVKNLNYETDCYDAQLQSMYRAQHYAFRVQSQHVDAPAEDKEDVVLSPATRTMSSPLAEQRNLTPTG